MEGWLIGHGKLAYIARMVGQLGIKLEFRLTQRLAEHVIQVFYKRLTATHEFNEIWNIVLDIPPINPGIILAIISPRTLPARKNVVKRLDKIPIGILGMKKMCFRMK